MGADPSIFQGYLTPPKSVIDYQNQYAQADQLRNQNALASLTLQQKGAEVQQGLASQNALQRIAGGWNAGTTMDQRVADLRNSGLPALMQQADALETQGLARTKTDAEAKKSLADAGKTTQETQIAAHQQALQDLSTVNTPEDAAQWMVQHVKSGALPAEGLQRGIQQLQQASADPQAFAAWKQNTMQSGQTVQQQMEQRAPKPVEVSLGNVKKFVDLNPYSPTYKQEVVGPQAIGVSPDAKLSADTQVKTTGMREAGETARAKQSQQTQLTIAGVGPDGSLAGNTGELVDMLGQNRIDPHIALQRLGLGARAGLISQVQAKYPGWDETTYDAKKGAAGKFTYGDQGNMMRSNATATAHLDQLEQLAAAVKNGNIPVINAIANQYGIQTGQAPAKVFDQVKTIIGDEVMKSIVTGGGSAGEREHAGAAFGTNSSPEQFLGMKGAVKHIMQAQYSNLLAQRRAAGLPDSTLPNYNGDESQPAPTALPGGFQLTHIDGRPVTR